MRVLLIFYFLCLLGLGKCKDSKEVEKGDSISLKLSGDEVLQRVGREAKQSKKNTKKEIKLVKKRKGRAKNKKKTKRPEEKIKNVKKKTSKEGKGGKSGITKSKEKSNKKTKQKKTKKLSKEKQRRKKGGRKTNNKKKNEKKKDTKQKTKKKESSISARLVCGDSFVNDTCLQNAVDALDFEKIKILNFGKQKARIINFNKTTGNKLGKNGTFEDSASYMLYALGGNITAPICGDGYGAANSTSKSLKSSVNIYSTLSNCSASIKAACNMSTTYNSTIQAQLDSCADIFKKVQTASNDCRTNSLYANNGTAACDCWSRAAIGIEIAKKEGCTTLTSNSAKSVKAAKKSCLSAFSDCKEAEDEAVKLASACVSGAIKTQLPTYKFAILKQLG